MMLHSTATVTVKVKVDVMHVVPISFAQREREGSSSLMKSGVVPSRATKPLTPREDGPAFHECHGSREDWRRRAAELFRTREAEWVGLLGLALVCRPIGLEQHVQRKRVGEAFNSFRVSAAGIVRAGSSGSIARNVYLPCLTSVAA